MAPLLITGWQQPGQPVSLLGACGVERMPNGLLDGYVTRR